MAKKLKKHWEVYIIETLGGRLYTGISTDVERRFKQHQSGKGGARFFKIDPPMQIRYREVCRDRSMALKREAQIKRLKRSEKVMLIMNSQTPL